MSNVTNVSAANMPFWPYLPGMTTNYGGIWAFNIIDPQISQPFMCLFNPAAASQFGTYGFTYSPFMPTPSVQGGGGAQMADVATEQLKEANINSLTPVIEQQLTRVEAKLGSEGLSAEDKTALESFKTQLEDYKQQIADLKADTTSSATEKYNKSGEIKVAVEKLVKEINDKFATFTTPATSTPEGSTPEGTTPQGATPQGVGESSVTPQGILPAGKSDPTGNEFSTDVYEAVESAYDAMYCWGTKDDQLEAVLNAINADNVMDLMLCWNKIHSKEKNESFMEAFIWDADSGQKETYCKKIKTALMIKAEQLGVYDELAEEFAKIDAETRSWVYIDNDIYKNFDTIIETIAKKMGSKYGTPGSTKTTTETEKAAA